MIDWLIDMPGAISPTPPPHVAGKRRKTPLPWEGFSNDYCDVMKVSFVLWVVTIGRLGRGVGAGGGDDDDVYKGGACRGNIQARRWTFGDPYNSSELEMETAKQCMQLQPPVVSQIVIQYPPSVLCRKRPTFGIASTRLIGSGT